MVNDSAIVPNDDMGRLVHLVRTLRHSSFRDQQQLESLEEVLENAKATAPERVPIDVITMNSHFRVLDLETDKSVRYMLVFPENANASEGRISILAPVGTAVLGRRRGDVVEAKVPEGSRRLKIEHVLHSRASRTKRIRPGQRIRSTNDSSLGLQPARVAA
ncbi:MAG: GreA/GreB family elongation factor [Acidobacteriia bacterium]|nr:GreA/GreB family elongation factor [Terriglobia bacterium]